MQHDVPTASRDSASAVGSDHPDWPEPIRDRATETRHQLVFRFPNDFGASVVRGPYTYGGSDGLWEVAVLHFDGESYRLTYDTPITDDVLGHQSEQDVAEVLERIAALPVAVDA